jgi:phosphotransferase system HPr (HPr) family protein
MLEARVMVENQLGLHARAAAKLAKLSDAFDSSITLIREDNSAVADAKSILSILTISASIGTHLIVHADGRDERKAVAAVVDLFSQKFGES